MFGTPAIQATILDLYKASQKPVDHSSAILDVEQAFPQELVDRARQMYMTLSAYDSPASPVFDYEQDAPVATEYVDDGLVYEVVYLLCEVTQTKTVTDMEAFIAKHALLAKAISKLAHLCPEFRNDVTVTTDQINVVLAETPVAEVPALV